MKIIVDKSIADLGKKSIVIAIAKNVNPAAKLSNAFLEKQKKMEEWALNCDAEEAAKHPVNQGYIDSISAVGRSTKKNPPTAVALIQNIKRRGSIPNINSIVDIYNVESLHSFLAIGGHDFDKIEEEICFTVSKKEDILGGEPAENAKITLEILNGELGAKRNAVLMNAGAGLYVAGKVKSIADGIALAAETIDSKKAKKKLEEFIALSNA